MNNKNTYVKNLHTYAFEFIRLCQATQDNLPQEEHSAFSCLAKDNSIVITKADKGNAIVKDDYLNKIQNLMDMESKTSKFEKLKNDETVTRERKLQGRLRELLRKGEINKDTSTKFTRTG